MLSEIGFVPKLVSADDWLAPKHNRALKDLSWKLLLAAYDLHSQGSLGGQVVDATVFVDYLTELTSGLVRIVEEGFRTGLSADRELRKRVNEWVLLQGLDGYVQDIHHSLATQFSYRLIGQTLFYYSFRRQQPNLPPIDLVAGRAAMNQLREYWNRVRSYDYEALFEASPLEEIPVQSSVDSQIRQLVGRLASFNWDSVRDDVLGAVFEQMIPAEERIALGQYYTPPDVADLMVSLSTDDPNGSVLDPAVGTGTFLMRAEARFRATSGMSHEDLLPGLWGIDISAFAAELAVINLFRLDMRATRNFPRIAVRDFLRLSPQDTIDFPPARQSPGGQGRVPVTIPAFATVLGNPPYVRSQLLDDLDPQYKQRLSLLAATHGISNDSLFDLFVYFFLQASAFLAPGGRLALVTSASWLTARFGAQLQTYLLGRFDSLMIIWSEVESLFPNVDVDTVITLVRKPSPGAAGAAKIRFVTLTGALASLLPSKKASDYWARVDLLADRLENEVVGDHQGFRVRELDWRAEKRALDHDPAPLNWARPLRAVDPYPSLFGGSSAHRLSDFCTVDLGYQSFLNDFFYVNADAIRRFGIEQEYLRPLYRQKDFSPKRFRQSSSTGTWLFYCKAEPPDLRGTGAGRYVQWGAQQRSKPRKQSQESVLWPETYKMKPKKHWYWPSSAVRPSNLALRKAVDEAYGPYILADRSVVDQRFYLVSENESGVPFELVSAYLSSSFYALALEVNGDMGMGGGVLTSRLENLRALPCLDLASIDPVNVAEIVSLARQLWAVEAPRADSLGTAPEQVALDRAFCRSLGIGETVASDVHRAVAEMASRRVGKAQQKKSRQHASTTVNVAQVATSIAEGLSRWLQPRRFPESFLGAGPTSQVSLPPSGLIVNFLPMLTSCELSVEDEQGQVWMQATLELPVAEVMVRAIQMGRRTFEGPSAPEQAEVALAAFSRLVSEFDARFKDALAQAGLGHKLRATVAHEVLNQLHMPLGVLSRPVPGSSHIPSVVAT